MPKELFAEFEGKAASDLPAGGVKYHNGFSSDITTAGGPVHLSLAFNPSHLEIVNPVVEGSVRARQERRGDRDGDTVLPVLVHGDAAFAGQGVVMETFQLSQTRAYRTGGTVHIIVNNQVGFTTHRQDDARSTDYCTDIAKMVQAPIFHVNGDDPEAVYFVTQIAIDYRMEFEGNGLLADKSETYSAEGGNADLGHYLTRLARKRPLFLALPRVVESSSKDICSCLEPAATAQSNPPL